MAVIFTVPGVPGAKGRPRFTRYGHAYTDKRTVEFENLVRLSFHQEYPEHEPSEDQLAVSIDAFFPIPKSASNKKKRSMMSNFIRPAKRPDCDNICKVILDALNHIAYVDDKQIVDVEVHKWYSNHPKTVVNIVEV